MCDSAIRGPGLFSYEEAGSSKEQSGNNLMNAWLKKSHKRISDSDWNFGSAGKYNITLQKALVVKAFGENFSSFMVNVELRRQWLHLGKFKMTWLGNGWCLCLFEEEEAVELVLANGPWYVKGNIIGVDRWSQSFSPNSLKGLTAPVWVRMQNLPLLYWDPINVFRITSKVGKPYLLDENMFQWGKREFTRICVHIKLEEPIPLGVCVDRSSGKFYQKIEYEKVPNICFGCGRIGHDQTNFHEKVDVKTSSRSFDAHEQIIHVRYGRKNSGGSVYGRKNFVAEKTSNKFNLNQGNKQVFGKKFEDNDGKLEANKLLVPDVSDQDNVMVLENVEPGEIIIVQDIPNSNKFSALSNLVEEDGLQMVNTVKPGTENGEGNGETKFIQQVFGSKLNKKAGSPKNRDCDKNVEFSEAGSANIKIKLTKELKSLGPVKLLPRGRKVENDMKEKKGSSSLFVPKMASIMFWNCSGAKKKEASLYLREMVKENNVFFVGILETKVSNFSDTDISSLIGEEWGFFQVPVIGLSGGILILWKFRVASFNCLFSSNQAIIGDLEVLKMGRWIVSMVYGGREVVHRRIL
ncbi:uncharacterized protein LOC110103626 [Dendrobium catenatum]|uniref:uncharacterized protein LOC110103626 n=1 Tax=Dendrobium catenatum TaxID=906689 RepID=UPI0009F723C6|nr:uncharacterized protein LOC110103626 [Dendrobium catenatum]